MKQAKPFIAICKDRPNDPERFHYSVFVVNNTEKELNEVHVHSSAFLTEDGELITSTPCDKSYPVLEAKSFILLETLDEGALDITTNYQLSYDNGNGKRTIQYFTLPKYLRNLEQRDYLPVLSKQGYLART
ncbi:hypothetical protein [Alkalihalobacillus sp. AL-G]|uniref:hypothetical protein n=1 Tax=Alkalihalobacillus sp. AL-G TaxID=2926399 RepID=UPI00272CCFCD|nr:hypothetical protein [Alkalihalobacillus sp. AL-G]WLD94429.1 hypothetical protein MOJ78_05945 [Alkalihalobacillus sp. AL-G]